MTKRDRGKTATIKERAIYVYLPSVEMAADWKTKARKTGVSISKFVIDRLEDSLRREEGEADYQSRVDLITKLSSSTQELKDLKKENVLLKRLTENLDAELRSYRAKPFAEEGFQGARAFDRNLIDLLRKGGSYSQDEILSRLDLDLSKTREVKAVIKQLEALEDYHLVEYSGRGWTWKG